MTTFILKKRNNFDSGNVYHISVVPPPTPHVSAVPSPDPPPPGVSPPAPHTPGVPPPGLNQGC